MEEETDKPAIPETMGLGRIGVGAIFTACIIAFSFLIMQSWWALIPSILISIWFYVGLRSPQVLTMQAIRCLGDLVYDRQIKDQWTFIFYLIETTSPDLKFTTKTQFAELVIEGLAQDNWKGTLSGSLQITPQSAPRIASLDNGIISLKENAVRLAKLYAESPFAKHDAEYIEKNKEAFTQKLANKVEVNLKTKKGVEDEWPAIIEYGASPERLILNDPTFSPDFYEVLKKRSKEKYERAGEKEEAAGVVENAELMRDILQKPEGKEAVYALQAERGKITVERKMFSLDLPGVIERKIEDMSSEDVADIAKIAVHSAGRIAEKTQSQTKGGGKKPPTGPTKK